MPNCRRDLLYTVAWLDASSGQAKGAKHSRSAIAVVGEDDQERVFILSCWIAHATTSYLIEQFFKTYQMWRPVVFGMDATGMQKLFAEQLMKEANIRNMPVPLKPMSLAAEKIFSIETTLQPIASAGRLFRPAEGYVKELREEWLNFPGDTYRDGLDALSCAIRLLPSCSMNSIRAQTQDQYRRYLERCGYTEDEIKAKIAVR